MLAELLESPDIACELALVTFSEETLAAAQSLRKGRSCRPELTEEQAATSASLAKKALEGKLVLFLGAAVSAGAGAPDWNELLEGLAEAAAIPPNQFSEEKLDYLDTATLFQCVWRRGAAHPSGRSPRGD